MTGMTEYLAYGSMDLWVHMEERREDLQAARTAAPRWWIGVFGVLETFVDHWVFRCVLAS